VSSSSIRNIIILAFISLSGIITTQIFWIKNALNLKEDQFNYKTLTALRSVANRVVEASPGVSEMRQINKKSDLNFTMTFLAPIHVRDLELFFIKEFKGQNINPDFKYTLTSTHGDTTYYSNIIDYKEYSRPQRLDAAKLNQVYTINVELFLKRTFLRDDDVKLMTFFSIVLLIVLGFFTYTIFVILRQKQLNEVKTDFVNNMTHEFKTPISTIALSSDVLMKDDIIFKPDRLKHYATIISEENKRLKTQVESVLQVSLIESHKLKLNLKPIDLHLLISNISRNFEPRVADLHGAILLFLNAERSEISGDEVHLQNIFFNLFDNAIKYSDKTPEITVHTENKAHGIEITVQDNGKGIPKEAQKMIFEKFYRVPSGNVHDVKGFGLGLFYVKNMVKLHKGKIELSSTPKVGTTFTLWFETKK
jgi:two-component system, OmpR family, phosphate regulon sensor histidine kinase PhoR